MTDSLRVELLSPDDWERYRTIRLRALETNPEAFGGKVAQVSAYPESHWRAEMMKSDVLIAARDEVDLAVMYVEVLAGDHGATCWIGGCWSDLAVRGTGAFRALFTYLDSRAGEKNWSRQGLGVWADNELAIAAYTKLGFEFSGELMPSDRQPGRFYTHMVRNTPLS